MKKLISIIVIIIALLSLTVNAQDFFAEGKNLYSDHVYMVNLDTGKVVFEMNSEVLTYPASLTKIMTCILAIERCENLDEVVTIPSGLFADIYADNAANMALKTGEELTVRDLINATMIRSACDSASALAWYVSGSIDDFVTLMNQKAREIGTASTHFMNAHGLHNENHYTTARDMFLIASYALENPVFCEIIAQSSCVIPATNKSDERRYDSTIAIEVPTSEQYYKYVTGVKSGFTDEAGRCLITKAEKDGESYLLVTLGANRDKYYENNMAFTDAVTLFEYHFAEYSLKTLVEKDEVVATVDVVGGESETVELTAQSAIEALVTLDENAERSIVINDEIKAPIKEGEVLGTLTIEVDGEQFSTPITTNQAVKAKRESSIVQKLGDGSKTVTLINTTAIAFLLLSAIILIVFLSKVLKKKR